MASGNGYLLVAEEVEAHQLVVCFAHGVSTRVLAAFVNNEIAHLIEQTYSSSRSCKLLLVDAENPAKRTAPQPFGISGVSESADCPHAEQVYLANTFFI